MAVLPNSGKKTIANLQSVIVCHQCHEVCILKQNVVSVINLELLERRKIRHTELRSNSTTGFLQQLLSITASICCYRGFNFMSVLMEDCT